MARASLAAAVVAVSGSAAIWPGRTFAQAPGRPAMAERTDSGANAPTAPDAPMPNNPTTPNDRYDPNGPPDPNDPDGPSGRAGPEGETAPLAPGPGPSPAWTPTEPPPPPVALTPPVLVSGKPRRMGFFRRGINIDLLEVGSTQAIGAGSTAAGIMLAHGAEIDLGPRLAVRLVLHVAAAASSLSAGTDSDAGTFVGAYLAPGVVYRFRHSETQAVIPYVTGALDLGSYSFGRHLLGLPAAPAGHGQDFIRSGVAPSVGAGLLFAPVRFIVLRLALDYSYIYVAHTSLHVLAETLAFRVAF